jgi:GNAT superfamily N-acetyltransferase
MRVTIRRTRDQALVEELHSLHFPKDQQPDITARSAMWVATNENGEHVGFCIARRLVNSDYVFLERVGVLRAAKGLGLQRRMIRVREQWARRTGARGCVTYTTYRNHPSITNLLRAGYRFYRPHDLWAGKNVHYYAKEFS